MVLQHKENFVTWDNLTKAGTDFIQDSDPCFFDGNNTVNLTFHHVQTNALPAVFTNSVSRIIYYRILWQGNVGGDANSTQLNAGLYLFDGTNYLFIYGEQATNTVSKGRINLETGTAQDIFDPGNSQDIDGADVLLMGQQWTWIRCTIDASNNVSLEYNDDNVTIKPDTWTPYADVSFSGITLGTLTEMGVFVQMNSGALQSEDVKFDDLEIVTGEGVPIDNAVVDGENIKLSSVYVKKTIGQVGTTARLTYHDPLRTLGPTVETAHRTVTTVSETKFNTKLIQGEIIHTDTMIKEIMVNGVEAKLARTIASYNPVFMEGVVEYIDGNTMYKQPVGYEVTPVFSSFGSLADKLIVFIKKRQKEYRCGLSSVDYTDSSDTPDAPVSTTGDITKTFFAIDKEFADADRSYNFEPSGIHDRLVLNFQGLIKDTSVINKATITLRVRIPVKSQFTGTSDHTPQMMIWDFANPQFRELPSSVRGLTTDGTVKTTNGNGTNDITGELQSKLLELVVTIPDDIPAGVQSDYFDVGAANAFGFKQHEVRVGFNLGHHGGSALHFFMIESAELKFDLDIDQEYDLGVAKIQTVNDHNLVFYGNAGISWMDADIRDDAISGGGIDDEGEAIGDAFFITDKISDIIEAFWVVSGMDQIMNINVTLTDEIPDIEDLRRVMILQYIQKISELLGAIYFTSYTIDPVNDLPTFNVTDSPVDTGQTWTNADFIEPMTQVTYKIDSSKELSTLKLIGKDGIIGTVSITSEHTPELGLETVQISRPDIHTARQAASWLSKKKLIYTNAYRYFSCRINYDRANQDYSIADIGKEVGVKNPADGSIVDHTSGSNGRLLIYQMELNRNWANGYSNYMTFILQQRFD